MMIDAHDERAESADRLASNVEGQIGSYDTMCSSSFTYDFDEMFSLLARSERLRPILDQA